MQDRFILDVGGYDEVIIGRFTGDITWSRVAGGKDLMLKINGRTLYAAGFFEEATGVELFTFADGTAITRAAIMQMLPTPTGEEVWIVGKDNSNFEALTGTEFNDTLNGGAGKDLLEGGYGDDTYIWAPGFGSDIVRDYGGQDKVIVHASPDQLKFYTALGDKGAPLIIQFGNHVSERLYIEGYFNDEPYKNGQIELIVFSDGSAWTLEDILAVVQEVPVEQPHTTPPPPPLEGRLILGTSNNDTLEGTTAHDTLDGGAADDLMKGGAGNDVYRWAFGSGNDTISDSRGTDTLSIHANASQIQVAATGTDSEDLLISLHDQKILIENYFLTSEDGGTIENIVFSDGQVWQINDVWNRLQIDTGSALNDVIYGNSGKNNLKGNDGHDVLVGRAGNDVLNGGKGNDKLVGGLGVDTLTGGTGKDVFVFGKSDTGIGKKRDVITDFKRSDDKLDLSGIDANSRTKADNAFTKLLSAKQKFTAAGQMRYDSKTGILSLNTDKDAAAEYEIMLKNKPAVLKLNDFIL
ncbi:M10 family metallopeptidase C-terminal domain-containing protein [Microvirga sp. ACRRW]|uniref:calcium-binding protein n=1 Tax=Microvirga sp. ACRRW TaxID=2918205 RepID=UPI001EF61BE3|nr:calcium-binding protein [Microvirga sp. ACRRW]MCG7394748.1 M10 family metallopeptidase C-terminal domain-containing protein [Microvirga sp. ACRRW]